MNNEILVIGGTGQVGSHLVDLLINYDSNFKLLARSPEKQEKLAEQGINSIIGAVGDEASLKFALAGIEQVFLLTSNDPEMFDSQKQLIDLAIETGIRKIVRLSAEPADADCDMGMYSEHGKIDNYLIEADIDHVILRPTYFLQNMAVMHGGFIKENNMFAQYLGETKIPMIDTRDIAEAAFYSLRSDQFNNATYYLTGPKAVSFGDFATALSDKLQRKINYQNISYAQQEAGLKGAGIPDWVCDTVMKLFKKWAENEDHAVTDHFEKITGKKAIGIEQYIADHVTAF
ncbi:MAG: NmrA family NAD(P)-binding protein [Colwellia sp.]|nr:NmrA family NAD(P)-binding protein [Colwellia sp.]